MNIATRSRQSRRLGTTTPLVSLAWLLGLVLLVAHDPWQSDHSVGGSHSCFAVVAAFQLSPSTQPGDVIERQLAALRDGDLEKVYEFASPGNKAQTGDVANFSRMVRSGPYRYVCADLSCACVERRVHRETWFRTGAEDSRNRSSIRGFVCPRISLTP